MDCPEPQEPKAKPRRGRPRLAEVRLDGPIPTFVAWKQLVSLIRQYRGVMYEERGFRLKVEQGEIPSYIEKGVKTQWPGVDRRRYRWEEVRAWMDSQMVAVGPRGITVNGVFTPRKEGL